MKTSDYVASFLRAQGVTHVFEVVGGMITHLIDSIHKAGEIKLVSMHHEQGAGFAAEGFARMTGVPGVAMATSGPGATNLITPLGSCHFDSTPAVFITGQVNLHEQKGSRAIRQLGFQETDIVSMVRPITKAAYAVRSAEELPGILEEAFRLALSGRPGPTLVDIPMDVQRMNLEVPAPTRVARSAEAPVAQAEIFELLEALGKAERPLILAGGGVASARENQRFATLIGQLGVPVVHSLMGGDLLPSGDPARIGLIGSYGNRWANHAIARCDFMLVLGSRLDVRQTGSETEYFKGTRSIWHVDVAAGEMNNRVTGCRPLLAHLSSFFDALELAPKRKPLERSAWFAEIAALRSQWPDTRELEGIKGINPNVLMHRISRVSTPAKAFVLDVGQHQMWAAQSLEIAAGQRLFTSGGMGAMGFALPAAVGASFATNNGPVVMIAGDGGVQLNLQELQTIARNGLPLKMVVLNNNCHGMVRQFQESYFHQRYASTMWGYSAPSFVRVAEAYGIPAALAKDEASLEAGLQSMWREPARPFLLEVAIDHLANAYPKLAFGRPITEMEPLATPLEMEGT